MEIEIRPNDEFFSYFGGRNIGLGKTSEKFPDQWLQRVVILGLRGL